jgi:hypothetical protein
MNPFTSASCSKVRTQVFTVGAGLKVRASGLGAAPIAGLSGLPIWSQLLLIAASPFLAGVVGSLLLTRHRAGDDAPCPTWRPAHDRSDDLSCQ